MLTNPSLQNDETNYLILNLCDNHKEIPGRTQCFIMGFHCIHIICSSKRGAKIKDIIRWCWERQL